MKTVFLNKIFKPKGQFDLVRLGKKNDSGYLVDKRDVLTSDILISFGVCHAWSFEEDFLKLKKVPIEAYDGTTGFFKLFKMAYVAFLTLQKQLFFQSIQALLSYKKFFSGDVRHHALMVGFSQPPNFVSLQEIINNVTNKNEKIFLKIDIEGWEYRLLDEIIKYSDKLSGLAIEFHEFDLHDKKVQDFIKKLPLEIAHVHCNNYGMVSPDLTPFVIEVTFSSHSPLNNKFLGLPHPLDSSNNKLIEDFKIDFRK